MRRRARFVAVLAAVGALSGLPLGPAMVARAAPACESATRPPQAPITAVPWAQRWLAPGRLAEFTDGSGVSVAVLDSGVSPEHPQMREAVGRGADFLDRSGTGTTDCVGHGTAVASVIAARKTAGIAFQGLAPGAKVLPVRISDQRSEDGTGSGRTVSGQVLGEAITWAVRHGATVINFSIVLYRDDPAVRAAVRAALENDVVLVAAVGNRHDSNGGEDPVPYPAAYDGVLGVGALREDGTRKPDSQVGPYVDVVAPGDGIIAAGSGRGHASYVGTSFAAPFVSATAALVRAYRPGLSAAEVVRRIVATADPAAGGRGSQEHGHGVLNPYRALTGTVATGQPRQAQPPPGLAEDPAVVAARRRVADSRELALWLGGAGGALAVLAALLASALPRGARRRWRPADPV